MAFFNVLSSSIAKSNMVLHIKGGDAQVELSINKVEKVEERGKGDFLLTKEEFPMLEKVRGPSLPRNFSEVVGGSLSPSKVVVERVRVKPLSSEVIVVDVKGVTMRQEWEKGSKVVDRVRVEALSSEVLPKVVEVKGFNKKGYWTKGNNKVGKGKKVVERVALPKGSYPRRGFQGVSSPRMRVDPIQKVVVPMVVEWECSIRQEVWQPRVLYRTSGVSYFWVLRERGPVAATKRVE